MGLCLDGAGSAGDAKRPLPTLKVCKFTAKPLAPHPPPPANKQAHTGRAGRQLSVAGGAEERCAGNTNLPINHSDPTAKMRGQSRAAGKLAGTPANPTTPCLAQWVWPRPPTQHLPAFPLNLFKSRRDGSLPGEASLAELWWHGSGRSSPALGRLPSPVLREGFSVGMHTGRSVHAEVHEG